MPNVLLVRSNKVKVRPGIQSWVISKRKASIQSVRQMISGRMNEDKVNSNTTEDTKK